MRVTYNPSVEDLHVIAFDFPYWLLMGVACPVWLLVSFFVTAFLLC